MHFFEIFSIFALVVNGKTWENPFFKFNLPKSPPGMVAIALYFIQFLSLKTII